MPQRRAYSVYKSWKSRASRFESCRILMQIGLFEKEVGLQLSCRV